MRITRYVFMLLKRSNYCLHCSFSAHQKAVKPLHPAAQFKESDNPSAKAAQKQRQRIKSVPQNRGCSAKDCHSQKGKGTYTRTAIIRKIIEYNNGKIHAEHDVHPQAQNYKHIQHLSAGAQIGEKYADHADQYNSNDKLNLIHKKSCWRSSLDITSRSFLIRS